MNPEIKEINVVGSPKSHLANYAFMLSALIIILAGIYKARVVLAPCFMAAFFAVLLLPPLQWLRNKGFSQFTSLAVLILSVLFAGTMIATIIGTQLTQFAGNLRGYHEKFNTTLMNFNNALMSYDIELGELFPKLPFLKVQPTGESLMQGDPNIYTDRDRGTRTGLATSPDIRKGSRPRNQSIPLSATETVEQETRSATNKDSEPKSDQSANIPPPAMPEKGMGEAVSKIINPDFPRGFLHEPQTDPLWGGHPLPGLLADPLPDAVPDQHEGTESFSYPRATEDMVKASSRELFKFIAGLTGELSSLAGSAFIITILVIFMLLESTKLPQKITAAFGDKDFTNKRIDRVVYDIRRYMVIKTAMSLLVGGLVVILLLITKVPYPFLWGFVAFLLNFIPHIGSIAAALPPIILGMAEQGWMIGGILFISFVVINCCIGYMLEPQLLGEGLDLSPLVVLISLIFCGWLLGAIGMFLSPPLAVIIKIILQSFPETKWIADLMANHIPKQSETSEQIESAES